MDAVFRPGIDTSFSPTTFDAISMEGSVENPIVLGGKEDKENSAPTTTTPVSERPPEPRRLLTSRAFGAWKENVPDFVYRNLFQ